jgi:hypothetical protein
MDNFNLKKFLIENKMTRNSQLLKEEVQKIRNLAELKAYLDSLIYDYVAATSEIAGDNLDWDGDGSNMGINKTELVNDFIGYLTNEIPYIK